MGGFRNSAMDKLGTLVRKALKSENYVAGTSGWQVTRDGNAEFNGGVFRGSIQVGNPATGEVIVDTTLTTALQAFYSPMGTISAALVKFFPGDGSYYYLLSGYNPVSGNEFFAMGHAKPGAILATDISQTWFSFFNPNTNISQINFGDSDHDQRILVDTNFLEIGHNLTGDTQIDGKLDIYHSIHIHNVNAVDAVSIFNTADIALGNGTLAPDVFFGRLSPGVFYFDNTDVNLINNSVLSAPYNAIEYGQVTAGQVVNAVNAGPEIAIPAASWVHEPNPTFVNGRLYRCVLQYGTGIDIAGSITGRVRVRKGSASITGMVLGETSAQQQNSIVFLPAPPLVFYIKNVSGANITSKLSVTGQWTNGGAGHFRLYGEALNGGFGVPLNLTIEDMGDVTVSVFANLAVAIV